MTRWELVVEPRGQEIDGEEAAEVEEPGFLQDVGGVSAEGENKAVEEDQDAWDEGQKVPIDQALEVALVKILVLGFLQEVKDVEVDMVCFIEEVGDSKPTENES